MKEFIDKLISRLEEKAYNHFDLKLSDAIEIVNQLAEEYKEERTLDCDKLLFAYSDLLRRFQNAESTVICEFSGNISKETEELEEECEELLSQFKEILYSENSPQKSAEEYINCSTDTSTDCSTKTSKVQTCWVIDGKGIHKQTNADRIRSMTDEELAEFIDSGCPDCARICPDYKAGCSWTCQHHQGKDFLLKWLQSEAE